MIILNTISDSSQSTLHRNAVQEILPATQKNQLQASNTRTTRPGRLLPVQHEEKLPPEQESGPRTNPDHWRGRVCWSQGQGIHRGKLQHPYRQWYAHPGNNNLEGKQERKHPLKWGSVLQPGVAGSHRGHQGEWRPVPSWSQPLHHQTGMEVRCRWGELWGTVWSVNIYT